MVALEKVHKEDIELSPTDDLAKSNFIWETIQKSFDPLTQQVTDTELDTSDFPLAKNFYDYCANLAGRDISMPFSRQMWIAAHLLLEICPDCSDPRYFHDIMAIPIDMDVHLLSAHLQYLENGVCKKCFSTRGTLLKKNKLKPYNDLVAILGQRSGKSTLVALISGYLLHILCKVPRLSSIVRGIQAFTPLTATFIALTSGRAKRLLWMPIVSVLKQHEWHKEYHKLLTSEGKRIGREILKFNNDTITYNHRNLGLYYMGPMKRGLRGDTRYSAAIDELGLFPLVVTNEDGEDEMREIADANEVYTSLTNSLGTIRVATWDLYNRGIHHIPTGYMLNTSSPMDETDKIWRLYQESKSDPTLLGINLPTWEVNPLFSRDSPFIVSQYRANAIKAERDFGATPPSRNSNWYAEEAIKPLFKGVNQFRVSPRLGQMGLTGTVVDSKLAKMIHPSVLAVDAGYSNNSFAFGTAHLEDDNVVVTSLGELIPTDGNNVWFNDVYTNVLKVLIQKSNAYVMASDRWQSISIGQQVQIDFAARDFHWEAHTLVARDFKTFDIDMIQGQRLVLPELEMEPDAIKIVTDFKSDFLHKPAAHLYKQFTTVRMMQGVMMKGVGMTDDLYRVVVLLATALRKDKVLKIILAHKPKQRDEDSYRSSIVTAGKRLF